MVAKPQTIDPQTNPSSDLKRWLALPKAERQQIAIRGFQSDPEAFLEEFLGMRLEDSQRKVCCAIAKPNARVCWVGANGVGKDALSAGLTIWFDLCFSGEGENAARVATTSASFRQVQLLWDEIGIWGRKPNVEPWLNVFANHMTINDARGKENHSALANGFKAANETKLEGVHRAQLLYILTEARGAEDWVFLAMEKACTREDNRMLVQSVPGEQLGEFFRMASRQAGYEKWEVIYTPAAAKTEVCANCGKRFEFGKLRCECGKTCYVPTTRLVTQQSIDDKLKYGEDSAWFQGPVLANFIKGSSLALITLKQYMDAYNRYAETEDDPAWTDILGVDYAWVGQNECVYTHRRGKRIIRQWAEQLHELGEPTARAVDTIETWLSAHTGGYVCIEHGIAQSGVIDGIYADNFGSRLVTINPGGPPLGNEEHFADRRSELYYYLAERFQNGSIAVCDNTDSPLCGQLTTIRKKIRGDLKFQMESKAEMAARHIPSPDWADSLMLTMAVSTGDQVVDALEKGYFAYGERTKWDW